VTRMITSPLARRGISVLPLRSIFDATARTVLDHDPLAPSTDQVRHYRSLRSAAIAVGRRDQRRAFQTDCPSAKPSCFFAVYSRRLPSSPLACPPRQRPDKRVFTRATADIAAAVGAAPLGRTPGPIVPAFHTFEVGSTSHSPSHRHPVRPMIIVHRRPRTYTMPLIEMIHQSPLPRGSPDAVNPDAGSGSDWKPQS